jgi:hypothetical protein
MHRVGWKGERERRKESQGRRKVRKIIVVHNINKLDSYGKSYNSNHGTCNEMKVILKFGKSNGLWN